MELKAGYRQTEAGVIPVEWTMSTVGKEFDVRLGKMLDAEKNVGEPKPYIGNSNVQWGKVHLGNLQLMRMTRDDMQRFRLRNGDLLACEGGEVGRAAIWNAVDVECYYQKALHRLRPLRGFDSRLMLGFLQLWTWRGDLANYVTQTSIAHLPRERFVEVPLPVPPLPEQSAIATALGDVDALLAAQDALIAKKRAIKQGAMQELLTGKRRLPGFSGEWDVKPLSDIADVIDPHPSHRAPREVANGIPFLGIGDLDTEGNIVGKRLRRVDRSILSDHATRYKLDEQLIGLGRVASIGKVVSLTAQGEEFAISPTLGVIRGREAIQAYLKYALRSTFIADQFSQIMSGSTRSSIGMEVLRKLKVLLPNSREEQAAVAKVMSDMDTELAALETQRAKTAQLKQGMMQALLTGRIRLV